MTLEHTQFNEIVPIIESFFGSRVSVKSVDASSQRVLFVLYDAFAFSAIVDQDHGSFGVIRLFGASPAYVYDFFGQRTNLRTGEAQIRGALEATDVYCRLQLPEKYLEAFDAAVLRAGTVDVYSNPNE